MPANAPTYVAWIADLVGSRELPSADRATVQRRLHAMMPTLDAVAGTSLVAGFVVTTGDEFQGLLASTAPLPRLLWEVGVRFDGPAVRVGIGTGPLSTEVRNDRAIGMDGPAFHHARAAITDSETFADDAPVFRGFGDLLDRTLDGLARALHDRRRGWTARQREVAIELRAGRSQAAIADTLGISQQAVSKHAAAAGHVTDTAIEDGLAAALALAAAKPLARSDSAPR